MIQQKSDQIANLLIDDIVARKTTQQIARKHLKDSITVHRKDKWIKSPMVPDEKKIRLIRQNLQMSAMDDAQLDRLEKFLEKWKQKNVKKSDILRLDPNDIWEKVVHNTGDNLDTAIASLLGVPKQVQVRQVVKIDPELSLLATELRKQYAEPIKKLVNDFLQLDKDPNLVETIPFYYRFLNQKLYQKRAKTVLQLPRYTNEIITAYTTGGAKNKEAIISLIAQLEKKNALMGKIPEKIKALNTKMYARLTAKRDDLRDRFGFGSVESVTLADVFNKILRLLNGRFNDKTIKTKDQLIAAIQKFKIPQMYNEAMQVLRSTIIDAMKELYTDIQTLKANPAQKQLLELLLFGGNGQTPQQRVQTPPQQIQKRRQEYEWKRFSNAFTASTKLVLLPQFSPLFAS